MPQLACECGKQLKYRDEDAGKRGRCSCGRELAIPKLASSDTRSRLNANEGTYTSGGQRIELASSLRSQQTLGQFVVLRKLGEGAMGEVWLAKDKRLGREVAIKVLPDDLRRDPERRQRFEREAKVMAKLHHPHTVTVHHLGDDDNLLYLVMEYVGGGSLEERVKTSGPLAWREATTAIRDAAAGLAAAHRLGLVHRDIKPANLLQSVDGVTKVGDFGLARAVMQDTQLTQQGGVLGTPSYMAPEQWEGKKADAKSDLYALICSYYSLLTGKPPFDADNWLALGLQHRNDSFPDPRQSVADIPKSVVDTLQHGSRKDPAKRIQTADELISQLDEILISAPNTDPPRTFLHRIAAMVKETAKWLITSTFPASRYPQVPRWASIAAGSAAFLFLLATVFFVRTPHGTLRIEVSDPQIEVSVDGTKITLSDKQTQQPIKAGDHRLSVSINGVAVPLSDRLEIEVDGQTKKLSAPLNGANLQSVEFNVVRNNESVVKISLLPPDIDKFLSLTSQTVQTTTREEQTLLREMTNRFREIIELGNPQDKSKLVVQLMQSAENADEPMPKRLASLRFGAQLAFQSGNFDQPLAICDLIAKSNDRIDPLELKVQLLTNSIDDAAWQKPEAYAEIALGLGFRCLWLERFENAARLATVSDRAARKTSRDDLVYQSSFLKEECLRVKAHYERVKSFEQMLRRDPTDPRSSLEMGKYHCFGKNDWRKGLSMVSASKIDPLATIATKDLEQLESEKAGRPTEVNKLVTIADLWWGASEILSDPEQSEYRNRAKYWYLKALGSTDATHRKSLAEKAQPRIDSLETRPIVLRIRVEGVDFHHSLRISNDGIVAESDHHTRGVKLNQLKLDGRCSENNSGSFRVFPSVIDFSTVKIRNDWEGQWGQIDNYVIRPDYVQINTEQPAIGECDFEITLELNANGFTDTQRFSTPWDMQVFTWEPNADQIQTNEGWDAVVGRDPIDRIKVDRLLFRCAEQIYCVRSAPSPKLEELKRWDYYAISASREWDLAAGEYEMQTKHDDGVRVFVDDKKVVEDFTAVGNNSTRITLDSGKHRFRVDYYEVTHWSYLFFSLNRVAPTDSKH